MDPNICRERILSEDYRDFVVSDAIPQPLVNVPLDQLCEQEADFGYRYLRPRNTG